MLVVPLVKYMNINDFIIANVKVFAKNKELKIVVYETNNISTNTVEKIINDYFDIKELKEVNEQIMIRICQIISNILMHFGIKNNVNYEIIND